MGILCHHGTVETVVFLPGYLSPPSGFSPLAQGLEGLEPLEAPRQAEPGRQFEAWRDQIPSGAHLVAFSEASLAAVRLAPAVGAKSLVLFSPFFRVDGALRARLEAMQAALRLGGHEAFVAVAKPWLFGSLLLDRGQAQLSIWADGLRSLALGDWLGGLLALRDERKWIRALSVPTLVVVGAEDAFTPMRYGHEVTEWVPEQRGMLVTVDGAGHFSPWENPGEASAMVRGFISRADAFEAGPPEWQEEESAAKGILRFDPEAPR